MNQLCDRNHNPNHRQNHNHCHDHNNGPVPIPVTQTLYRYYYNAFPMPPNLAYTGRTVIVSYNDMSRSSATMTGTDWKQYSQYQQGPPTTGNDLVFASHEPRQASTYIHKYIHTTWSSLLTSPARPLVPVQKCCCNPN